MSGKTVRRLAASILGVGESRIWLDPTSGERIADALTRDDVRRLIDEKVVKAFAVKGVSRHRARKKAEGRRVGRHRGHGSRKGTASARLHDKDAWMAKVRSQRKLLRSLRSEGRLDARSFRAAYMLVKGSTFRGRAALISHLKEGGALVGEDKEIPKSKSQKEKIKSQEEKSQIAKKEEASSQKEKTKLQENKSQISQKEKPKTQEEKSQIAKNANPSNKTG